MLWHIFVQHPDDKQLIELIGEYMVKEGRDLELIKQEGMNVRSVNQLEACKGKLRAGLYVMIKRMQIVFREINVNKGEVDSQEIQETNMGRKSSKPTIYQTIFEDKDASNSKAELILDFIYLSLL